MRTSRLMGWLLVAYGCAVLAFLYLPLVSVGLASISKARYLTFPIRRYAYDWYGEALASDTVRDLLLVSLKVAGIVTVLSTDHRDGHVVRLGHGPYIYVARAIGRAIGRGGVSQE